MSFSKISSAQGQLGMGREHQIESFESSKQDQSSPIDYLAHCRHCIKEFSRVF